MQKREAVVWSVVVLLLLLLVIPAQAGILAVACSRANCKAKLDPGLRRDDEKAGNKKAAVSRGFFVTLGSLD